MGLTFYKYQATGNDFVLIDNRSGQVDPDDYVFFEQLCHRRFGVGADGVILLGSDADTDFAMHYYNADGRPGSMCGNGGRAVVRFAQHLGLVQQQAHFVAIDGLHEASMEQDQIWLKMGAVSQIEALGPEAYYLDTGSPHYVRWCQGVQALDVYTEGRAVRYSDRFRAVGTNVNFAEELAPGQLRIRTYERGVEDETYSCGTGATAVACVYRQLRGYAGPSVQLHTAGGLLTVEFRTSGIWLGGPALCVFRGEWIDRN